MLCHGWPLGFGIRICLGRSGHPKRLASFKIRRAAGHADILQAPVAETLQLVARTRATPPFGKALFHLAPTQFPLAPTQHATRSNGHDIQAHRGSLHVSVHGRRAASGHAAAALPCRAMNCLAVCWASAYRGRSLLLPLRRRRSNGNSAEADQEFFFFSSAGMAADQPSCHLGLITSLTHLHCFDSTAESQKSQESISRSRYHRKRYHPGGGGPTRPGLGAQ